MGKLTELDLKAWTRAGRPLAGKADGDGLTFTLSRSGTASCGARRAPAWNSAVPRPADPDTENGGHSRGWKERKALRDLGRVAPDAIRSRRSCRPPRPRAPSIRLLRRRGCARLWRPVSS